MSEGGEQSNKLSVTARLPVLSQDALRLLFEANGAFLGKHGIRHGVALQVWNNFNVLTQREVYRSGSVSGIGNSKMTAITIETCPIDDESYVCCREHNESIFDEFRVPQDHRAGIQLTMKLWFAAMGQAAGEWPPPWEES